MKRKTIVLIIVIIVLIVAAVILARNYSSYEELGEKVPIMGKNHIQLNEPHEPYNSNPPTSGPHAGDVEWGIYQDEIQDENAVHNLEHGGVWITYKDKNNEILKNKLEDLVKNYKSKVLLSPRLRNDSLIAVVSWGRIMKLDVFDAEKIKKFIKQYKNKGPEFIPD